jgi:hypothetical protein
MYTYTHRILYLFFSYKMISGDNTGGDDSINFDTTSSYCRFDGPGLGLCAWSTVCYFVVNCMMCCIPRPDAWIKGSEGNDANNDVAAIPVATANTARAEEEMTSVATGIAPEPEAQVAEEVVVEAHA